MTICGCVRYLFLFYLGPSPHPNNEVIVKLSGVRNPIQFGTMASIGDDFNIVEWGWYNSGVLKFEKGGAEGPKTQKLFLFKSIDG